MKKYSMETAVGIFIVIGLICVGYMTVKLGKVSLFGDKSYPLYRPVRLCHGTEGGKLSRNIRDPGGQRDEPVDRPGETDGNSGDEASTRERKCTMMHLQLLRVPGSSAINT